MKASNKKKWTEEEIKLLTELYPHHPTVDLVPIFNRSEGSIQMKAMNYLKLKKTPEVLKLRAKSLQDGRDEWKQFLKTHMKYIPILKERYDELMSEYYLNKL
jgi:hypothetical protein